MRFTKKSLIIAGILFIIFLMLSTYKMPYYVNKPGLADDLTDIVNVEDGHTAKGSLHLVTISSGQATPINYITAKLMPHQDIVPMKEARNGMSDELYMEHQMFMMENSQHAAMVVAYEAADKEVEIIPDGVHVIQVMDDMPADGKVKAGDKITAIDGENIKDAESLTDYVKEKQEGDVIDLDIERDDETLQEEVDVVPLEDEDKVGIGIRLVTDEGIEVNPEMSFDSGKIGGPSAGLMFSLEVYNQLTEEDITNGYNIVGTGEIDQEGNVHPIGGIDKKVVAADKEDADIFFAPYEDGKADSNYEVAKETADNIHSDMDVVPVDSFQDALDYLTEQETTTEAAS